MHPQPERPGKKSLTSAARLAIIPVSYTHLLGGEGSVNSWSLPLDASGQLPAYVAILPPENWSGTIENIALTVYSGESSLEPTADTATFDLEVIPVADGVNLHPTLTFGTEGSPIPVSYTHLDVYKRQYQYRAVAH